MEVIMPVQHAIGRPAPQLKHPASLAELLGQAFDRLSRAIRFAGEDDIVRRYEGHSWCDSTERNMNYDIMTGRCSRD
jgi:hypothetical protein